MLRRGNDHLGLDRGHIPDGAVNELDVLDLVTIGGVAVEVAVDAQAVGAALEREHQRVTRAGQQHIGGGDACAQLHHVRLAGRAVVAGDSVAAITLAEDEDVVARIAGEVVIADTAVQGIVA